jgi:hypothetical protein
MLLSPFQPRESFDAIDIEQIKTELPDLNGKTQQTYTELVN